MASEENIPMVVRDEHGKEHIVNVPRSKPWITQIPVWGLLTVLVGVAIEAGLLIGEARAAREMFVSYITRNDERMRQIESVLSADHDWRIRHAAITETSNAMKRGER